MSLVCSRSRKGSAAGVAVFRKMIQVSRWRSCGCPSSSQISNLPFSGDPPLNTLLPHPLCKHTNPEEGPGSRTRCVSRGEGMMDTVGASLRGIWTWDRIRVKQSLWKVLWAWKLWKRCYVLHFSRRQRRQVSRNSSRDSELSQQSASWCVHPDGGLDSWLRFTEHFLYPHHIFTIL